MKDTFYLTQVLQANKAPIRYISQITWISMPTLKAIKSWANRRIQEAKYNDFISWYKKYIDENIELWNELLEFKK